MGKISTRKSTQHSFIDESQMQPRLLPQKQTIAAILNYSKSFQVKKVEDFIIAELVLN